MRGVAEHVIMRLGKLEMSHIAVKFAGGEGVRCLDSFLWKKGGGGARRARSFFGEKVAFQSDIARAQTTRVLLRPSTNLRWPRLRRRLRCRCGIRSACCGGCGC